MAGEIVPYTGGGDEPYRDFANTLRDAAHSVLGFGRVVDAVAREVADAVKSIQGLGPGGGQQQAPTATAAPAKGQKYGQALGRGAAAAGKTLAAGGNLAQAAGAGLGAAGSILGGGVAAFSALFTAASGAVSALDHMSAAAIRSNEKLAQFSASMAQAVAQRDVQEIFRQREFGERLSGSARELFEAQQRSKDSTKELTVLFGDVSNVAATAWNDFKAGFMRQIDNIAGWVNEIRGSTRKNETGTFGEYIQKLADEDRKWREKRFDERDWAPTNDKGVPGGGTGGGGTFD